jgi:hypothetical protein
MAKRAVSTSNLRGIGQAVHIYANDHGDQFPPDLEALIALGMITRGMLVSPRDYDEGVSYVYIPGQNQDDDPNNVLAFERIIDDEGTNVLFLSGAVVWMSQENFEEALMQTMTRLGARALKIDPFGWE